MSGSAHGDDCGCCTDVDILDPVTVVNEPGRPRLARRIGTHGTFRARLEAGLSRHEPTRKLTTRDDDDWAITLLDAWAVVADTITFYTERFANEHYVGTATERRSMAELARLIGRDLRPGLAAETRLAFTMDTTPGAPDRLELQTGSAVQSEPEPGGEPAVYETIETAEIRPAWNRLRARAFTMSTWPGASATTLHLAGTSTGVKVGDGVAWQPGASERFAVVTAVATIDEVPATPGDPGRPGYTIVTVDRASMTDTNLASDPRLGRASSVPPLSGAAAWLNNRVLTAAVLDAEAAERRVELTDVEASIGGRTGEPGTVVVFRQTAALFGATAPPTTSLAESVLLELSTSSIKDKKAEIVTWTGKQVPWDGSVSTVNPADPLVLLDAGYPSITAGTVMALYNGSGAAVYAVDKAAVGGHAQGGISGKTTRITTHTTTGLTSFGVRSTAVFAQSVLLERAPEPVGTAVSGTTVELDALAIGLVAGRSVVVTGAATGDPGRTISHLTELTEVTHDFGPARSTTLTLSTSLPEPLMADSVTVNANVVNASHGFTRSDVLGSGDGRSRFQRFALSETPLTYVSAANEDGRTSTLRIFVDDIEWFEVNQFPGYGPNERVFVTHETEKGTTVQFGDGVTGARLPTGTANVRAVYRVGAGRAGRVGANRLTTLAARPAGLSGVTNPVAAEGGAEPETADQARANVAVNVRTLRRVVSLRDYEDFARSFSGVAKAQAVWGRGGTRRGVIVTVAGEGGDPIAPGSPIHDSLLDAYAAAADELVPIHLLDHRPRQFRVVADLNIAAERIPDQVRAEVDAALREAFSFDRRSLGQAVRSSELLAVIHQVPGVVGADLRQLRIVTASGDPSVVPDMLVATAPAAGAILSTVSTGAELLTIEPHPVTLGDLP